MLLLRWRNALRSLRSTRTAGIILSLAIIAPTFGAATDARLVECLNCHAPTGTAHTALTPYLGGQPAFFVLTQLFLFRGERRDSAPMIQIMKGVSDGDMQLLSDAVAKLPPPAPPAKPRDKTRFDRGRALAKEHRCTICHNPDFSGKDQVPRLANQREEYLLKALRDFKSGKRLGYGGAMAGELTGLSDADLVDLAHYATHLAPVR